MFSPPHRTDHGAEGTGPACRRLVVSLLVEPYALPATPDDLTPSFLTHALREGGVLDGGTVDDMTSRVIGEEWGFTGVVARAWLDYRPPQPSAPATLIAKFPMAQRTVPSVYQRAQSTDEASRLRAFQRSAREVLFYQQIAPLGPTPAPRLYYGAAHEDTRRILLLLEDLHGQSGDVLTGAFVTQVADILRAMAPFHARWWEDRALDGLQWLPRWGDTLPARAQRYAESAPRFLERFGDQLPTDVRTLIDEFSAACLPLLAQLHDAPTTIIHGDLHLDNVIFGQRGGEPVWIIDWQGVRRDPAVQDLTLVAWSLPNGARREAETRLLRAYHQIIIAQGVSYSFEALYWHYQLALLADLAGIVTWLANADFDGIAGRQRAMTEVLISDPRLFTALIDHHALDVVRDVVAAGR